MSKPTKPLPLLVVAGMLALACSQVIRMQKAPRYEEAPDGSFDVFSEKPVSVEPPPPPPPATSPPATSPPATPPPATRPLAPTPPPPESPHTTEVPPEETEGAPDGDGEAMAAREVAASRVFEEIDSFHARSPGHHGRQLRTRLQRCGIEARSGRGHENRNGQSGSASTAQPAPRTPEARLAELTGLGDEAYAQKFLVVMLPDPLDSNLTREFDLLVDALRKAFEYHGFVMDRFSLPWAPPGVDASKASGLPNVAAGDSSRNIQNEPGIVLFRKDGEEREVYAVLLVGENPTWGVQKGALLTALDVASSEMDAPHDPTIRLIGPVYSGSALSLGLTLREWLSSPCSPRDADIRITSGTATRELNREIIEELAGQSGRQVHYSTVATGDKIKRDVLYHHLWDRFQISRGDIALLVESSAFGSTYQNSNGSSSEETELILPFPMHISQTRTERVRWEAAQKMNGGANAAQLPRKFSELDISGASSSLTALRPFAPLLTARTAEMTLSRIVSAVSLHQKKAVGIIATDIRDQLFLAKVARQHFPDVLLFSFEGDALLAHPDYSAACRGMILASSNDFIEDGRDGTEGNAAGPFILFPNDRAHGLFRAVRTSFEPSIPIAEPVDVWIHAVGRGDLWPIATTRPNTSLPIHATEPRKPALQNEHAWFVVMLAAAALLLIYAVASLGQCRTFVVSWFDKKFRERDKESPKLATKDFLMPVVFGALCLVLSTPYLLTPRVVDGTDAAFSSARIAGSGWDWLGGSWLPWSWPGQFWPKWIELSDLDSVTGLMLFLPGGLLSIILASFLLYVGDSLARQWNAFASQSPRSKAWRISGVTLLVLGLLIGIYLATLPLVLSGFWFLHLKSFGEMFLLRASTVLGGVSPIVSLAFLAVIPLVGSFALRYRRLRRAEMGDDYCKAKDSEDGKLSHPEDVFHTLLGFGYLRNDKAWKLFVFIIVILAPWFNASSLDLEKQNWSDFIFVLRGFEKPPLDEIASILFIFGVVYLFRCWIGVLWGWSKLRQWLRHVYSTVRTSREANELCKKAGDEHETSPIWADPEHCDSAVIEEWNAQMASIKSASEPLDETNRDLLEKICRNTAIISRTALNLLRRDLVYATITGLLLLAALVAYPYQPNRFLVSWITALVGLVALSSVVIISMMDRDPVLSRLFTPSPDKLNWTGGLAGGFMSFAIVPLFAVAVSQYPGLQDLLVSWLSPVLRFFSL